jgi:riboflavin synthase
MFSGIIAAVGRIESMRPWGPETSEGHGVRLRIHAGGLALDDVALGDSIAVNGACMTVVERTVTHFEIDVSRESLDRTAGLDSEGSVNLEKSLTLSKVLGGHLVSGHVDGRGTVAVFKPVGESWHLAIDAPAALGRFFAYKGSVTVQGVSLTVNRVEDSEEQTRIHINLIPHTLEKTNLRNLRPGDQVNLEVDLIARYCDRLLGYDSARQPRR